MSSDSEQDGSWFSAAYLAKLQGQQLQEENRGERYGIPHIGGLHERRLEAQPEESRDTSVGEDPNDDPVPDDSALPALPAPPMPSEMPAGWWEALHFGKPGDAVSPQDARLALALIEARLAEGRDSGHSIKRGPGATVEAVPGFPTTVEALHEKIRELDEDRAWFAFQQLYHEAAGLHPRRKPADASNAVSGSDAAPLNCDPLEPGLVEAIMQAPSRVQRWMLAPPREPPPWRAETAGRGHTET